MGGRRDDSSPGRGALPPVPPRPAAVRAAEPTGAPPAPLPPLADEPAPRGTRGWLVLGLVLAAGATAAVFFTDDPLYLRVALLAVCWAFVVAAFLAGNRRADQVAAAGREAELRHAYDLELEREVAARHAYEGELQGRLRGEAEQAMRTELAQLRSELSGLSALRDDLAAVTQLRADLAGLGQLRTELAALTELRTELTGLGQLRAELAGLGELRTDLGRMRSELTEQLSGELFIERMVMRAQSVRGPAQPAADQPDDRTLEGAPAWDVDRWSETRTVPAQPAEPAPRAVPAPPVPPVPPVPPPVSVTGLQEQPAPPSPLAWLDERSLLDDDGRPTGELPAVPRPAPRRHRRAAEPDDDLAASPAPEATPSWAAPSSAYGAPVDEAPSWETPAPWEAPATEAPAAGSSAYGSSAYGSSAYGSSSYEPSWETPSWETPAWTASSWETSSADALPEEVPARADLSAEVPAQEAGPATGSGYDSSAYDDMLFGAMPAVPPPAAPSAPEPAPRADPPPSGHARLEQILAESGVQAPTGGRSRRRRYRDEDDGTSGDDVLARVLGR